MYGRCITHGKWTDVASGVKLKDELVCLRLHHRNAVGREAGTAI